MDLSIVIPSYNEEESLPLTIKQITELFHGKKIEYELILVDNGSHDKTAEVISLYMKKNPRIKLVTVKKNEGWGNGVIKGSEKASGKFLVYATADLQTPVDDIFRIYEVIRNEEDKTIVKVKRDHRGDEFTRYMLSKSYNFLINLLFGFVSSDVNATPKIMQTFEFRQLEPIYKDYFIDAELLIKAKKRGFRIIELPTQSVKRKMGKSNIKIVKDSTSMFMEILKYRFQ